MARKDSPEAARNRDDIKGRLISAVLKDFQLHGESFMATLRKDMPQRYIDLVQKLAGLEEDVRESADKSAQATDTGNARGLSAHAAKLGDIGAVLGKQ